MKRHILILAALSILSFAVACTTAMEAQDLQLPNAKDSFHFAVIGDSGTGGTEQYQIGEKLNQFRAKFPFDVVVMMGDNLYGGESPRDYQKKFELPFAALLNAGVKFYASLGNHDDANQRFYEKFNMNGEKYYTFKPRDDVRFFALDSNYIDQKQTDWLDKELAASGSAWKIVFFHHPLYSSGETHGSSVEIRKVLEPIFLKHGVSLVLSGHEHFYERIKPQRGIPYIILGSSAKLRRGDIQKTDLTAKGFDTDYVFMLCEVDVDQNTLSFQAITRAGKTIDSGAFTRVHEKAKAAAK